MQFGPDVRGNSPSRAEKPAATVLVVDDEMSDLAPMVERVLAVRPF
jgi:hypothetical protein